MELILNWIRGGGGGGGGGGVAIVYVRVSELFGYYIRL